MTEDAYEQVRFGHRGRPRRPWLSGRSLLDGPVQSVEASRLVIAYKCYVEAEVDQREVRMRVWQSDRNERQRTE